MIVKENVLFFRTRQEKLLTFGETEKQKKKKLHDRKLILLLMSLASITVKGNRQTIENEWQTRSNLIFFSHLRRKTAHFWRTRETENTHTHTHTHAHTHTHTHTHTQTHTLRDRK